MLKWLFSKTRNRLSKNELASIDSEAVKIVQKLKAAGFESYLVGGCVRDVLMGKNPKDFDIATKASPQQVRSLIHRSFIIGRRFRIVVAKRQSGWKEYIDSLSAEQKLFPILPHTLPENEYQITTFRRQPVQVGDEVNENVFGNAQEDAERRDFTVNALYLDPTDGKIVDFVGGLKDLSKKELRIIGDPQTRFQEDPIRVLRALRFAHKNRLKFEAHTGRAMESCAKLLKDAKRERIREEILKILKEGSTEIFTTDFVKLGLWPILFPEFGNSVPQNRVVLDRLTRLGRALKQRPWPSSKDVSPLISLFFWVLEPVVKESYFTDLRVSKNERLSMDSMEMWIRRIRSDSDLKLANRWVERPPRPIESFVAAFFILSTLAHMDVGPEKNLWKRWEAFWSSMAKKLLEARPGTSAKPPRRRPARPHSALHRRPRAAPSGSNS
jgi:tRNA nucleotidyltransferase/poly(A) polymerase